MHLDDHVVSIGHKVSQKFILFFSLPDEHNF
jgi:hypothetical protein